MEIEKLQSAIEAILFTMGDSVEISKLAFAIGHDEETTKKLVRNMMERYEKEDRGIRIIELEDSFQLCTKKEMYEYLIRVAKQPKRYALTDVLLETLNLKRREDWMPPEDLFCLEQQKSFFVGSACSR